MPQREPVTILIVNENAEEMKLVTISMRGFFPDCRIDTAYSSEEAIAIGLTAGSQWSIILLDEQCLSDTPDAFVGNLKQRTPHASVILQSSRTDAASALQALRIGADYFLSKQSPAFLTELLFCTKEAIHVAELRRVARRSDIRHQQLIATLDGASYELDAAGTVLHVSPSLLSLLGYQQKEVVGRSYHMLFSERDQPIAQFRFNERRALPRETAPIELTLRGKRSGDGTTILTTMEVRARGLYDESRRFLGTIGILRDLSEHKQQEQRIRDLLRQVQQGDELRAIARQIGTLAGELQQPLSTLLQDSQLLYSQLHEARVLDQMESLSQRAAVATGLGKQLDQLLRQSFAQGHEPTVNNLLEDALVSINSGPAHEQGITTDFSPILPAYDGDRNRTILFFQRLLIYSTVFLEAANRSKILVVRTRRTDALAPETPTLFPLTPSNAVTVEIYESDRTRSDQSAKPPVSEPIELLELYNLASALDFTLDLSAPASGPLRLIVRIPESKPPSAPISQTSTTSLPGSEPIQEPSKSLPDRLATTPLSEQTVRERRTHPRVLTTLPAQVTIGSSRWEGTVNNLGLGGAEITLPQDFPSIISREAYIVIRTAVGILELSGHAYERTPTITPQQAPDLEPHIITVFNTLEQTESAVLASMIEATRERSVAFTFEILLTSNSLEPQIAVTEDSARDPAGHDRRESLRVPLALPVRLETSRHREPPRRLVARMMNLSRNGACLLVSERPEFIRGKVTLHFAPSRRGDQLESHEPSTPDTALNAEVVWSVEEQTAIGAFTPLDDSRTAKIAVRFGQLTPYAEREVIRVIKQHVMAQRADEVQSATASIVSVPRECRNARGQAISIVEDHRHRTIDNHTPTVILAPGFGQTASDYAAFSYYLAAHHLRVLRYDHTNHVGVSEGELQHATLRSLQQDLSKVIEFVRHTWPQSPIIVIASDLAARAAFKVAAQTRPLDLLLLVNPSIDVGAMLTVIHGHDLVADYQFGLRRGISNLFGLNINLDLFVGDLIAGHYTDLGSTIEDLRLSKSPLAIVNSPAKSSAALPPTDLPHAFMTALGTKARLMNLPAALTDQVIPEQQGSPPAFKRIYELISTILPLPTGDFHYDASISRQLDQELFVERELTSLRHEGSQIARDALLAGHLTQVPQLGNLHEYRKLLDDLYTLMSPLNPGTVLIDAGGGQSDLTRAVLVNHTYRAKQTGWTDKPSPIVIGVGRSRETLDQARNAVRGLQRELSAGFVGRLAAMPGITVGWVQADWTARLPFQTGSLDRLLCNLSLPYVASPLLALREWNRVLGPNGRLILTTFHPDTDFSMLYRKHIRQANQDEFSSQAQPLLNYFGRLREAIRHHLLHTFDQTALSSLLKQVGITSATILPIFDGQALVAIVEKQNSASSIR